MFTRKLLKELNSLFFRATNITLSLSYSDKGKITYLNPPKSLSKLCKWIQSTDNGEKCYKSDSKAIETAIKTKKAEVYCCHAGLINIALPIIVGNNSIGTIFAGPLLTHKLLNREIAYFNATWTAVVI